VDGVVRLRLVVVDDHRSADGLVPFVSEYRDLLLAHLVGQHEEGAVAFAGHRDGESDSGFARGRLDDRPARLELPLSFGLLDHGEADPVLHRPARVEVLELGEDPGALHRRQPVKPYDRRRADQLEEIVTTVSKSSPLKNIVRDLATAIRNDDMIRNYVEYSSIYTWIKNGLKSFKKAIKPAQPTF